MKLYKEGHEPKEFKEKAFQKEKLGFNDLSFKKKCSYIWDYYKGIILSVALIVVLAIVIVPQIMDNMKPTKLYLTMVNTEWSDDDVKVLFDEYADTYDINLNKYKLTSDTSTVIVRNSADQYSMDSAQKISALIGSNTIDVFIADTYIHDMYSDKKAYFDLRDILDEEFIELYGEYLYYTEIENEDGSVDYIPYGIQINHLESMKDAYVIDAVAGVILNTKRVDESVDFIYMIFDYQK